MNALKHLAIIMDGNGRWAQKRNRPRTVGHVQGVRIAKRIIQACSDLKIPFLTLYAFSSENWSRPSTEVAVLMKLLHKYLKRERENLHKLNIKVQVLGQIERLPEEIVKEIVSTMDLTKNNTGMVLNMCLSYSGRSEITEAFKKFYDLSLEKSINRDDITEEFVQSLLETHGTPDPDLMIRTSGEKRISNFLLWQLAYTEFYFTDTLWPDFNIDELVAAVSEFQTRQRRFGRVESSLVSNGNQLTK